MEVIVEELFFVISIMFEFQTYKIITREQVDSCF